MKLIDADELERKIKEWLPADPCGRVEKEFPFETDICVSTIMEIEEAEAVDAEPVVHAHWVKDKKHPMMEHCSHCGYEPEDSPTIDTYDNTWLTYDFLYCPECGAKMDEVKVK